MNKKEENGTDVISKRRHNNVIREARVSDFEAVSNLENQVFTMHQSARKDLIKPKKEPFTKTYFESCLNDDNTKIFVYEEDEEIQGHCIIKVLHYANHHMFYDMKVLEIDDLCVDEKARGKGIGRQLFDKAKNYAKKIGASRIELTVWSFNKNARQFYECLGMSEKTSRMELTLQEAP